MNPNWLDFLSTQQAVFLDDGTIQFAEMPSNLHSAIYPLSQLGMLKVTGHDAAQFLQGQLTCNVNELKSDNSFFAAFCNAKGRTITTLLIFKQDDDFFLILPSVLLEKVHKKLKMYILRSAVQLSDVSHDFCFSGLCCSQAQANKSELPVDDFSRQGEIIKLPNSRYLIVAKIESTIKHWNLWLEEEIEAHNSHYWNYLDISSGLAWLDNDSSEEYIPQMLNIDKLGGISFDKGCYTGQEVVARTHYLGKAKRALFVAECAADISLKGGSILNENGETVGKIINNDKLHDKQRLLIVMQTTATEATTLKLDNPNQDAIQLI